MQDIWPLVRAFIARSYHKCDQEMPRSLVDDLVGARKTLWLVITGELTINGAGITGIYDLATGRMCKIEHFGGDGRRQWIDQRKVIEEYAKREGCDRVMIEGRLGWARLLTDYETTAVILEKRL